MKITIEGFMGITIQIEYWVLFEHVDSFFADHSKQVFDKMPDLNKIKWPETAYAFTIFKREYIVYGGKRYKADLEQVGKKYYHPESRIEDLEQVKTNPFATKILIDNMKRNGWDKIIWTRFGNFPQPYIEEEIEILEEKRR